MAGRAVWFVAAAALLVAAAALWQLVPHSEWGQHPAPRADAPDPAASRANKLPAERRALAVGDLDPLDRAFAEFAAGLAAGKGPQAARDLRRILRQDPAGFAEACAKLLDLSTPADVCRSLALVLGTLACEGVDAILLAALKVHGNDASMVQALVAALGALRDPPDDDDVFDPVAAPHFAFLGPGGMSITVRNLITDPAAERALGDLLLDRERAAVRAAAANALQFSVDSEPTRTRFRTVLAIETDAAVAARLGESLGLWTRRRTDLDATATVTELLRLADREGFDEYRLRLESALQECSFEGESRERLISLADVGQPSELREFALSILAGERPIPARTRAMLLRTLAAAEPDAYLREVAARHLGQLGADEPTRAALERTWLEVAAGSNVRVAALTALFALTPATRRAALLQQASTDPDVAVARCARSLGGG